MSNYLFVSVLFVRDGSEQEVSLLDKVFFLRVRFLFSMNYLV